MIDGFEAVDVVVVGVGVNATGVASMADLMARLADTAQGALLDLGGGNTLLFRGVALSALTTDQFLLVPA